jgi:phthalate 4,5-dioxygenase oxygenase subunit
VRYTHNLQREIQIMISQELNDSLTRVGPGTDAGRVLRQYWQPAALSDELMVPRPVVP